MSQLAGPDNGVQGNVEHEYNGDFRSQLQVLSEMRWPGLVAFENSNHAIVVVKTNYCGYNSYSFLVIKLIDSGCVLLTNTGPVGSYMEIGIHGRMFIMTRTGLEPGVDIENVGELVSVEWDAVVGDISEVISYYRELIKGLNLKS